jgi:hypothetical protein
MLGVEGSAEKLMARDPKHGIQALIREGRQGEGIVKELALKELDRLGIDEKTLMGSSDTALRDLALGRMKTKEDAKTIGQSVKEAKEGAEDWWHADTGKQVKVLAEAKNAVNLGGRGGRGVGWKIKMRIFGDVEESTAGMHKLLQSLSDEDRVKLGLSEDDVKRMIAETRTQFEREQVPSDVKAISAPALDPGSRAKMDALLAAQRPNQTPQGGTPGGPPPGPPSLDDLRAMAKDIDVSKILGGRQPGPPSLDDLRAMAKDIGVSQILGGDAHDSLYPLRVLAQQDPDELEDLRARAEGLDVSKILGRRRKRPSK